MTDRSTDHWLGRHYHAAHIAGPVHFLNPTTRLLGVQGPQKQHHHEDGEGEKHSTTPSSSSESDSRQQHVGGVYNVWRSRDNRKGRHALALMPSVADGSNNKSNVNVKSQKPTNTLSATLMGIVRMVTRYPVWDVSYDVAVIFTIGSVVWVLNGFFVLLPITNPSGAWSGESSWGGGVSACVGATIFEVGSVLLMLEAVNENRSDCFGWALEEALEGSHENLLQLRREASDECRHHHVEKRALLARREGDEKSSEETTRGGRKWTWCPSWNELRTHYFRDIGFLACFSQMIGATVFWISGITGLPQILDVLSVPATNGIYWLPQVIGGTGFIISSWLFMLETQSKWYIPAPRQLGWHIGFWNLVGALGFTLCGALGFASSNSACEIGLTWATFIGSWAFLIGSIVQWYESLDKYPCIIDKTISKKLETATTGNDDVEDTGNHGGDIIASKENEESNV